MQKWRRIGLSYPGILLGFVVLLIALAPRAPAQDDRPLVIVSTIEGAIGPASTLHVENTMQEARQRGADVIVLKLNTPGGLVTSMRDIIAEILDSDMPVVGYVSPSGAHAASAGTYILYATHVAAMAPGTNLGAATPVQIGGAPGTPDSPPAPDKEDKSGEGQQGQEDQELTEDNGQAGDDQKDQESAPAPSAMDAKATNDAVAFIRSLAEMHGRNADWAEKAVREAASLSADAALDQNVIDLVADSLDQLLADIDGRVVTVQGEETTITTADAIIEEIEPDMVTELLGILSNPNVAFILMTIGLYGLIFEFSNPGSIGPGVVGVICLILGLFALNQLPLDYAGLALILLGMALMVAEVFTPTFGALGAGGLVAFIVGAAMLIDTDVPAFQISWWVIGSTAVVSGLLLILLLGYLWRALRSPVHSGAERLAGATGQVLEWSGDSGFVWAEGERWNARGKGSFAAGDTVRIRGLKGLTLEIESPGSRDHTEGEK